MLTEVPMSNLSALERQLLGYRLTTAEILYHLPDHPRLLQTFVWQDLDLTPDFPILQRFLDFWERELDARLHSVKVASVQLIKPAEVRLAKEVGFLH